MRRHVRALRSLRRAPLFAGAGVALSIAVAWACAWDVPTSPGRNFIRFWQRSPQRGEGEGMLRVDVARRTGVMVINARAYGPRLYPQRADQKGDPRDALTRLERTIAAPWVSERRPWPGTPGGTPDANGPGTASEGRRIKVAGWPLPAVWCELRAANAPDLSSHTWTAPGGLILGDPTFPRSADWPPRYPRILPYRPVCWGLGANAALYGGALAILWAGLAAARRRLRRGRGACTTCGYDLCGLAPRVPCPECGRHP